MRKARRSASVTNKQTKRIIGTSLLLILAIGAFFELEWPSSSKAQSAPQLTSSAKATKSHAIEDRDQVLPPAVRADELFGKLPLSFEANEGQFDSRATYVARGQGYGLFLTRTGAVLSLRKDANQQAAQLTASLNHAGTHFEELPSVLSLRFEGANASARITAFDELPGRVNYFIGNDARKWRRNVQTYARVRYGNVYPGVDVIYYGDQRQLEYDFVLAPGSDPHRIKLGFRGASTVKVDASGDLVLTLGKDEVHQRKPIAYQEVDGQRREVNARYQVESNRVTLKLGDYDKRRPLVIDPVLIYSSFLGGTSSEDGLGVAVDAQGSAYLTGSTLSTDFPLANAFQTTKDAATDAFVVKLNAAGTAFVYSTYLGANGSDTGNAIAVDAQGNAYVAGLTGSGSFPATPGVFQNQKSGFIDGFLAKLSSSGSSLVYATFLGGDNNDTIFGVAVGAAGRAHVVGRTDSTRLNFLPLQRHGNPAYKSTNGAGNWSASASELTGSTVNTFAIDPASSNTIYAGSNVGVFKSIDAGGHWNLTGTSNTGTAPQFTNTVVIDPTNPNIIYAGASSGVHKSTNGGSVYAVKNTGFVVPSINALAIDPNNPATLYAGTAFGVYKSTNGADNWVEIKNGISGSSPRVNEVVIDPSNPATVYMATNRGMFKTTNGGALWFEINGGALSNLTLELTALTIDPLNPSILYASGRGVNDVIFKTTQGGANWTGGLSTGLTFTVAGQSFIPTVNTLAIDPVTPATLYAATTGGAIYKTTNGGANWSQSNTGITNTIALGVTVDRNNPATVYAGTTIGNDAFIVRFDPSASVPEYFLNFGGDESDEARGVTLDADGNAFIVGTTNSTNFPAINAVQPASGGFSDAFVSKLNAAGSGFVYSTYLGGNSSEQGRAIVVRAGSAYVTGVTSSPNFPLANAFKSTLAQFDTDAFVTKLNPTGTALDFSSYLGGSAGIDQGLGIAVDTNGSAYVTGLTSSSDFPTLAAPQPGLNGSNDAFVTKLNAAGTALLYSTYLGGVGADQGNAIAVDALGNAYVIGTTSSANFPTVNPFQPAIKGTDAFVTKIGVQADLSITKTESRDPVMVNNPLTYTLKVSNAGPSPVTGVTVTDTLPGGLTFGSATSTLGTCSFNSGTVTCDVGNMPVAGLVTITLAVTPTMTGTISNTATATASEFDNNTANNSATETTRISASPSINGRVTDTGGAPVSGVLMTLSGPQSGSVLTDSNGFYQFAELAAGGTYVVTPTKANLSIDPQFQTFSNLSADQTTNFVATTCTYSIAPTIQSFPAAGGLGSVTVTSLHDCVWTAVSSANWITITQGGLGSGSGTVSFTVSATTAPRSGHITIAGKNFAVYQEFNSCAGLAFTQATYNFDFYASVIKTADLNGDGLSDLVGVNTAFSGGIDIPISVLLNNGAGGFSLREYASGSGAQSGFVLGDYNGDGSIDVATLAGFFPNYRIKVYVNNGTGQFLSTFLIPYTWQGNQASAERLYTADLNNDGKLDFLVRASATNQVQVLLNNGNGTFSQASPVTVPTNYFIIDTADFNNDGSTDLLLGFGPSSAPLAVMLGNGNGTFSSAITSGGIDFASTAVIGDFDSDGKLDLVVPTTINTTAPPSTFSGLVVMSGDGNGHFSKKSMYSMNVNLVGPMTTADMNSDGKLDLAFTSSINVIVLFGDGLGNLANPFQITTGEDPNFFSNQGIVAADFVADGHPDLALGDGHLGATTLRNTCGSGPIITGRVTDVRTFRDFGATVTLTGAQNGTTQTDSGGNYVFSNLTPNGNYLVTPSKQNYRFNPVSTPINNLAANARADFVGTPIVLQFSTNPFVVDENGASIDVTVRRTGDLSGVSTVDFATEDALATARTDYTSAFGTLQFGPGESLKSFTVLISDDNLVEGFEYFNLRLSNPTGAVFNNNAMEGSPPLAVVQIRDNDIGPPASNPLDDAQFFVRQHYYDFLSRLPDPSGFNFWTGQITQCGQDPTCLRTKRIDVSNAFFYELEFQQTGSYVYRLYRAAFGNNQPFPNPIPDPNHPGEEKKVINYDVFSHDRARVVGGSSLAQAQLDLANAFVLRPEFVTRYPANLDGPGFVDAVLATIMSDLGADLTGQRQALITLFNSGGRGAVIYRLADDNLQTNPINNRAFIDAEYNRAFVATQYFGYLRRDPDMGGFLFWLGQVSSAPLRDVTRQHAMVCSFITSAEYQLRFSTLVTHSNSECQ